MKKGDTFNESGFNWEDSTSYSQSDKVKEPTAFSTKVGTCTVTITNGHIHHRPAFVFTCYELGFQAYRLPDTVVSHASAAKVAISLCRLKLRNLTKYFNPEP